MAPPILLQNEEVYALTRDARIVAIRWDLLEWGLVLDLDVPVSEAEGAAMKRAWIAFSGVAEVTLPMREARLPSGIWLTSAMSATEGKDGFFVFSCGALLPVFDGNVVRSNGMSNTLSVRAQGIVGVVSRESEIPGEYGLSLENRRKLCREEALLGALTQ